MKKFIWLSGFLFCALLSGEAFARMQITPDCVPANTLESLAGMVLWFAVAVIPFAVKYMLLRKKFPPFVESPAKVNRAFAIANGILYGPILAIFCFIGIASMPLMLYLTIGSRDQVEIILSVLTALLVLTAFEKLIYGCMFEKGGAGSWKAIFFAAFAGWSLAAVCFYLAFILPTPAREWPMTAEGCLLNIPKYSHVELMALFLLSAWAFRYYRRMADKNSLSLKKWFGFVLVGIGICVMTLSALTGNFNLRTAFYHDQLFGFRLMLAAGADPNKDPELFKLAVMHTKHGKGEFIKALLDSNLDLSKQDVFTVAARTGNLEVAKLSLEKGKAPADVGEALVGAASNSDFEMAKLLIDKPFSPAAGQEALALAAEKGNLGIVKLLVEKGVDANAGWPLQPLEKAITAGYRKGDEQLGIVQYLLEHGAEPEVRSCRASGVKCTEKNISDEKSRGGFGGNPHETMLCLAIMSRAPAIAKLLLDKGADPHRIKLDEYNVRSPSVCIEKAHLSDEMRKQFEDLLQSYGVARLTAEQKRTINVTQVAVDRHREFLKKAEAGDVVGQFFVGGSYIHGNREADVLADPKLGFSWIMKAAENGSENAQCDLPELYLNGTGIEQSKIEAYFWYRVCSEASPTNKIVYESYIDRVRQSLTNVQIEEAERRVEEWLKAAEAKKAK